MTTTATIRKSYGNRKSYPFPEDYPIRSSRQKSGSVNNLLKQKSEDVNKLIKYIDDNIVGKSNAFLGPFGRRKESFAESFRLPTSSPIGSACIQTNFKIKPENLFLQSCADPGGQDTILSKVFRALPVLGP
ncbi:hypothetical protein HUJ04_009753 [Dendroctonus ponderosae]|nr:hypothetical protein HUJ04_009752 [Dendroctonus ponderosae]KAH1020023.1 hypothetical protein HUJ04_009753 [Dendroctonus ponderosae]